ncbi:hypothetical protein [Pseudomonas beijingensis]|jgi:hypothetical protein|uniref:hypothetical protein n=1 Tax=Pseudomonas beijingensis TaxID=2954101 RepID=UPI0027370358|nr:hypothetical protein [Pseudomonas sp. FP2262]WLH45525.1 hypothetical protein PSH83_24780 [Pseudomonas sp. FP2262]
MDSEHSFYATLDMFSAHINLLERLHGKPALATVSSFSGGFYTGKPQTQDHSHLLGMRAEDPRTRGEPLRLHFRHMAGGYLLTIKNTGEHYNKLLSKSWFEILGAKDANTKNPTIFNLMDFQQKVITPETIKPGHTRISLMTANRKHVGGLRLRGSPYLYLAETEEQSKAMFILSVL